VFLFLWVVFQVSREEISPIGLESKFIGARVEVKQRNSGERSCVLSQSVVFILVLGCFGLPGAPDPGPK